MIVPDVSYLNSLRSVDLRKQRREVVYFIGAAVGILLDLLKSKWREKYFTQKFFVDKYYH